MSRISEYGDLRFAYELLKLAEPKSELIGANQLMWFKWRNEWIDRYEKAQSQGENMESENRKDGEESPHMRVEKGGVD